MKGRTMSRLTHVATLRGGIARFRADESGATAIEYALIASGVAATIAATYYSLTGDVKAMYENVANKM
jgi:Flp pilus assembly pilin Flp